MKITVPAPILFAAVKAASSIIKAEDERQILRNLLFIADDKQLEIISTDTTVSIWRCLQADDGLTVVADGRVAVNAQQIQRVLDSVGDKKITITADEKGVRLTGKGSRHRLWTEDAREFPKIARFSLRKPFITLEDNLVPQMIDRTAYCAHTEASFFMMHGLLVRAEGDELRMVATNGQRLAVATTKIAPPKDDEEFEAELMIPAEHAKVVKQIINKETKTVDVQWMANFLNFRTHLGEVSVRALAGQFPQYQRGIPSGLNVMKLKRTDLIGILKQSTAFKNAATNFVALSIEPERMVFAAQVDGVGDSVVEHEVAWGHEPLKLTIDPDLMLDALNASSGDEINLEVRTIMTPTMIRESGNKNLESFCVFAVVRQ